jgi:hypothetical protein
MEGDQLNNNLLGQDPLAGDTYFPQDFEGMLARVVRIDRATSESTAAPRRRFQLRMRMPVVVAIASLAGASLAGAGLAAAASGGGPRTGTATASLDVCGVQFVPAPSGTSATVSFTQAVALFHAHSPGGPTTGQPTAVSLSYATAKDGPAPLSNTLVWSIVYNNLPIAYIPIIGGLDPTVQGTWLGIVDAQSGNYLYTSDCNS